MQNSISHNLFSLLFDINESKLIFNNVKYSCSSISLKVIAAEGEKKASASLNEAANMIAESPCAIQLRYLQTLNSIRFIS